MQRYLRVPSVGKGLRNFDNIIGVKISKQYKSRKMVKFGQFFIGSLNIPYCTYLSSV